MRGRRLGIVAVVLSGLALVISAGLPAWAASVIDGRLLKNGSVTGAKLRDATITGRQVRDNSLGGADIDESKLARVPDAAALGGKPASAFIDATQVVRISQLVDSVSPVTLASNGSLAVAVDCHAAAPTGFHLAVGSLGGGYTVDALVSDGSSPSPVAIDFGRSGSGIDDVMQFGTGGAAEDHEHAVFTARADTGETISGNLSMSVNKPSIGAHCVVSGYLIMG
jgi:hypothetical protein